MVTTASNLSALRHWVRRPMFVESAMPSKVIPAITLLAIFSVGTFVGAIIGHLAMGALVGLSAGFIAGLAVLVKIETPR
jgi:hypothetical protein